MEIRLEKKEDYLKVETLIREAFYNVYRPGCFEHLVMHRLRCDPCFIQDLDYLIEEDNQIVAHIAYAHCEVKKDNGKILPLIMFGPISVLPEKQHEGYGSKIINYTLKLAKEKGYEAVLITGNPDYYHRFGFESASKYNIYYEGMDHNDEASFFMIKILNPNIIDSLSGEYSDPKCYLVTREEADEYDNFFPYKKKEKRAGQLGE